MSRIITAAALIALTTAATACDTDSFEVDHQTKASTGITEVIVTIDNGAVYVTGTKETQAKAHVEAAFGSQDFKPAVDFREEGSKLYINADCGDAEDIPLCRTDIEISMPEGAILRADGNEASLSIKDMRGVIHGTVAQGSIDLNNVSSSIDLSVREGNITGDNLLSTYGIIDTQKGNIDLVFLAPLWNIATSTARGDIKLTMPKLTYQIDAETASGSVDIRVPQSSASRRLVSAQIAEAGDILMVPTASGVPM